MYLSAWEIILLVDVGIGHGWESPSFRLPNASSLRSLGVFTGADFAVAVRVFAHPSLNFRLAFVLVVEGAV